MVNSDVGEDSRSVQMSTHGRESELTDSSSRTEPVKDRLHRQHVLGNDVVINAVKMRVSSVGADFFLQAHNASSLSLFAENLRYPTLFLYLL